MRNTTSMQRLFCGASATMMILGAGLLAPSMAFAQDAEGGENIEAVVVTGTRLAGFDTPTPVTSLAGAELQANNARNVADLITDVPQLRVRRNIGQTLLPVGLSQIDLRGLNGVNSSQRTLVMIDGRRVAPTAYNGWIDANVIPTGLLNRVEVVTGGASAAYGSDAVAGVVNFILDRKFTGLKADLSYGQSKYRDNRQPGASVAFGTGFNNDRGHLIASAEYFRDSGQLSQEHRPWGRQHWCQNSTQRNGRAFAFYRSGCNLSQITAGGVTATNAPAALQNIQFGPGGTVLPFQRGTDVGGTFMTGGGPGALFFPDQTIAPKIRRYGGFAGLSYDITDNVELFADVLHSNVFIYADSAPPNDSATATSAPLIQRDNAYLPAQIRTILAANPGIANFRVGRWFQEDGGAASNIGTKHTRATFGLKGDINANWSWETYGAIARTKYYNKSFNQRNVARFNFAADAVLNPATNQIVCRATLQNNPAAAGCVPFNPFGPGSVSQASVAYYTGTSQMDADMEQDVWAATLRGTPFHLPAGDVSVATGVEARRDSIDAVGDPVSNINGWKSVNQPGYKGKVTVKEGFAEVGVPLLADMTLVKKLDINAAGRITDYSISGTVKTWKIGANYEPNDWIRFRGTLSRDIRAPTAFELFRPLAPSLINQIADPLTGVQTQVFQSTGGNPTLRPEVAKTFTGGVVFSPAALAGFRMSIDYYRINIRDVISNLTIQQTFDQCYVARNAEYCALILRNPGTNQIERVIGTDINSARLKTAGVDIEAQYRFSVDNFIPWGGNITLRSLGSYTEYRRQTTAGVVVNLAGQNYNGIPYWRVNSSITYDNGPVMFRVSSRYMSSGLNNKAFVEGVNIEDNRMPSAHYIDLAASYQVNRNLQFYANVNNLFNQWPALDPNPITEPGYQGGGNYDLVGQWFSLGVRLTY